MTDYNIPPLDIQIEIMKRLPVKSLMKFRAVSKQWKSIIHSSEFIADYNCRIQQQPHQVFVGYYLENYVDIFDDDDDNSFLQRLTLPKSSDDFEFHELIGYSQGLFGFHCSNYMVTIPKDDVDSVVVIWNPSIRESVFVPLPAQHMFDQTDFVFTVCNATDPTIFKTTNDIVGFPRQVEIFTLSTGSWRTLSNAPRESLGFTRKRVVIDRFIYWIASDWTPGGSILNQLILSFDITGEQFTELCLPPTLAHTSSFTLGLSKHKESLVVLEKDVLKGEIGVWMMMEPGVQNSFTKLYAIKPSYKRELPTVLGFRKNGQPIIYSDLESFNDIEVSGYGNPSTSGSYMETLLLLDH